jgi:hypothetical protein
MIETIAILKIVSGSPENLFKESLLAINRKVPGYFSLKCNTTVVFANFCVKTAIDFRATLFIILVNYIVCCNVFNACN